MFKFGRIYINMSNRNYITATINSMCLSALIDSGADENTMSVGMLRHLFRAEELPPVSPSQYKNVVLADGKKRIRVLGKIFLPFNIQGTMFNANFHIKETDVSSVILGNFFLRQNFAVLDFARSLLTLKPESNVKASENVCLPPGATFHIIGQVESVIPDGSEGRVTSRGELKR